MTEPFQLSASLSGTSRLRWRKELVLAAICFSLGLILLPALIYAVGVQLLGAYGGGPQIGSFYGDFFRNLIGGVGRTWFIVLTPYLLVSLLRLMFWPWSKKSSASQPGPTGEIAQTPAAPPASRERREPFVAP